jgi:hypothetical protein
MPPRADENGSSIVGVHNDGFGPDTGYQAIESQDTRQ